MKSGYVILQPNEAIGEHTTGDNEEMLIILHGIAQIECEGESSEVGANSVAYIPKNSRHNVINHSTEALKYIYVVALIA
jgi:mannose-6-phosphate isomerase-like protein (cupin superfamily)